MKNRGGRSTHYAQHIKRHRSILGLSFDIYVDREATLTEDMTGITSRLLRDVSLVLREGYEDEQRIQITEREDITALRDALTEALTAIEDDQTMREARA